MGGLGLGLELGLGVRRVYGLGVRFELIVRVWVSEND